jgi:hypothetical protein
VQQYKSDLGLLALRFLDHTQFTLIHSVGLLWIRDRPVAEAYLAVQYSQKKVKVKQSRYRPGVAQRVPRS